LPLTHTSGNQAAKLSPGENIFAHKKAGLRTLLRVSGPKRSRFEKVDALNCRKHNVRQLAALRIATVNQEGPPPSHRIGFGARIVEAK
jgi:hypothetical protein